jgi:glycosyltransferase involved in cell wall biosynthesis
VTPPRVAYVVGYYPAVTHTFITREIDRLRAAGMQVDVFSLHRAPPHTLLTDADRRNAAETSVILPPPALELLAAHLRALLSRPGHYLRTLRHALRVGESGVRHRLWQLFYFGEGVLLWRRLCRRGIRHVHAHFAHSGSAVGMLAAELGAPERMTFSFTMHGQSEFDEVVRYALADKVRCAQFVACIGHHCRAQMMRFVGPEQWPKLSIIRCGVDVDDFALAGAAQRRPGDPLRILCVGRLVPDKGQSMLIEACRQLLAEGIDVRLRLVGDGSDRTRLEQLAARHGLLERITFSGSVGQDAIRELYAEADVFCLPSFAEGIPVVLMEAMARGCPVVATRVMGVAELVDDGHSGLLVAPADPDALAAALQRIALEPELGAALVTAARARVEAEFSLVESTARLRQLFGQATQA